jgi:hypothetical protein
MSPPLPALVVTAAGFAWVLAWALWRGWTGRRPAHLALAAMLAGGVAAMATDALLAQVAAGLAVVVLALRLLLSDRGPGFLTAAASLVAGLLLAAGTPWPGGR